MDNIKQFPANKLIFEAREATDICDDKHIFEVYIYDDNDVRKGREMPGIAVCKRCMKISAGMVTEVYD